MDSTGDGMVSRRSLLKAAAAGAVVGIPAVVFMTNGLGGDSNPGVSSATASAAPSMSNQPVVAFVRDASKGEVVVMSGVSEVVITDKQLVARLQGVVEG